MGEEGVEERGLLALPRRERREHRDGVRGEDRPQHRLDGLARPLARQALGVRDPGCAAHLRQQLVGQRQGVPHAAAGEAGDLRGHAVLRLDLFGGEHLVEARLDLGLRQRGEAQDLAPRDNRVGDLVQLRGGEEELDVRGRLLERLQQGVEGALRQHVHLVDEEHLEASGERDVGRLIPEAPDVVDAGVGRRVDLDEVRLGSGVEGLAPRADAARLLGGSLLAVERLREQPRGGGLAGPPRAEEEVRVPDPVLRDGPAEGAGHHVLPRHLGEGARAVLPGEDEIGHRICGAEGEGAPGEDNPSDGSPVSPNARRPHGGSGGLTRGRRGGVLPARWAPLDGPRSMDLCSMGLSAMGPCSIGAPPDRAPT